MAFSFVNIMLNSARFDPAGESYDFEQYGYGAEGGVPVEVKAGDVVFFNGYTLHRSLPNTTTDCYRRCLGIVMVRYHRRMTIVM